MAAESRAGPQVPQSEAASFRRSTRAGFCDPPPPVVAAREDIRVSLDLQRELDASGGSMLLDVRMSLLRSANDQQFSVRVGLGNTGLHVQNDFRLRALGEDLHERDENIGKRL